MVDPHSTASRRVRFGLGLTVRRLAGNVLYLGAGEGLARIISFGISLVVARDLGPARFGGVALAQAVVFFFAALGDGGLTVWMQRQIVLHRDQLSRLVSETIAAQLLLGGLAMAVMCVVGLSVPFHSGTGYLIIAASPFALTQALTTDYALQAVENMRSSASVRVWTQVATAVFTLGALTANSPMLVVISLWAGQFVGAAYSIVLLWRRLHFRPLVPSFRGIRTALRFGLSLLGAISLSQSIGVVCTLLLGVLSSGRAVGIFSAVGRPVLLAPTVFLLLGNAFYPEMIRRFALSPLLLGDFMTRVLRLSLRLSFVAGLCTFAVAKPLIHLLYGQKYDHGVEVLRILGALFPAFAVLFIAMYALTAAGMTTQVVLATAAGAVVAAALAPALIAAAGADGAASTLVASHVVMVGFFIFWSRRFLRRGQAGLLQREIGAGALAFGGVVGLERLSGATSSPALLGFVVTVMSLLEVARGFPTARALGLMGGKAS